MTSPLALIFYESLLAGNQLVNRLQDLGYRVVVVAELSQLPSQVVQDKPLLFVCELGSMLEQVCVAVRRVRTTPDTAHLPVLAFLKPANKKAEKKATEAAQAAGVTLVAGDAGFLGQLPQLLERALEVK